VAEWKSRRHLDHRFQRHGRDLDARTVEAYDASAREVVEVGTFFEFRDPDTGEWRVGYYDRANERLTILTDDEAMIVSHFRCLERYVEERPGSTYA
jgi:hypothetical protein